MIEGLLARGGMGVVWRATDLNRKKPVAIKAVANDLLSDPQFKIRIQDEARRHVRLDHPNIVTVTDVFNAEGNVCIVMEYIDGESLANRLEKLPKKRFEVAEALRHVKVILRALDYAHRNGIVHRDVKPSNIILDSSNQPQLIDFGIALAMGEERRTRTGQTVGTPLYMSPEQIAEPKKIDHRSDVYSVGCVFYEMLTGRPPFIQGDQGIGNTDFAIQEAHIHKQPLNPRTRVPSISSELDRIILAALQKNPDMRIPGCQEFLRLLEDMGSAPDIKVSFREYTEKRKYLLWIIGGLLALLLLFLITNYSV